MVFDRMPEESEHLARQAVDAGIRVHSALGPGLLESAYEHCLAHELGKRGVDVQRQVPMPVTYDGEVIDAGYRVDLLIGNALIIEIKAVAALLPIHEAQLLTYLRLSGIRLGLLMNFNVKLLKHGIKRLVR